MKPQRRRVKRVLQGLPQTELFPGLAEEPAPEESSTTAGGGGRFSFDDPSPARLCIGSQTLESFLRSSGQTDVFVVRRIVRSLDYSRLFERYQPKGRTPYHPALYLGLILYGHMLGLRSLRELERLAKSNVCCWWLTGGAMPDHSSIGRFVQRHRQELSVETFIQLTAKVLEATGGSATDVSGDGTLIEAAASRYRHLRAESARLAAEEARAEARQTSDASKAKRLERTAERLEKAAEQAEERTERKQRDRGPSATVEPVKVSPTDPDSVYQKLKTGMPAHSYKPVVFANEQRVIVAQDVQPSSESCALDGLCRQAETLAGQKLKCVRLDAGFFNSKAFDTLLEHDVEDILISGKPVVESKRARKPGGLFPKKLFRYDAEDDSYTCPAGHKLRRRRPRKGGPVHRPSYSGAPCQECPLRDRCTRASSGRIIRRSPSDEVADAMRKVMEHPLARRNYARRAAMVEPVFADLRGIQRLQRFARRGLRWVRLEFSLQAMAHNLRRMLAIRRQRPQTAPGSAPFPYLPPSVPLPWRAVLSALQPALLSCTPPPHLTPLPAAA